MMEWTLMTSTRTGGILSCGTNGESIRGTPSEQVCGIFPDIYINLIDIPDEDRNAVNAWTKSIKTLIEITTDAEGEPEIPSVIQGSGFHTKVVQTAVRNYCTAHIRE